VRTAPDNAAPLRRVRATIEGTVQGVGFRPHVFRLCEALELAGYVGNDERGVVLEVEGGPGAVDELLERLVTEAPPLAIVERVVHQELAPCAQRGFRIVASHASGPPTAAVSPDVATCAACLTELWDPADRRYRYPFVNCTNCGPRFTIVRGIPYDRARTTMAGFVMCAACRREYEDPRDRRYHAQPIACPACGPKASLVGPGICREGDAVAAAGALLRGGAIVAVKGLGGYHLACRADDEDAVATLRARKHREDKPFALLARDHPAAGRLVELGQRELDLLSGPARPIVLARRRAEAAVAAAVAPGAPELGVMLPYTPLHHLLAHDAGGPLVLTSGNVSDEPIAYEDDDALDRLDTIADAFLLHDRPIRTRTDDSVVRVVRGAPLLVRRSRGIVPARLALPIASAEAVLGCGAELKSTFCLADGHRAWVGHHIGDLTSFDTLQAYRDGISHYERLFAIEPSIVAHDLHPDYLSTRYALEREGVRPLAVQHHHAHLAACLAEHGETGPAVGAIYDGAGLGPDGTVWGGELMLGDLTGFERVGHLWPVRLPGGDRAAREPWRMACAWLVAVEGPAPPRPAALAGAVDAGAWAAVSRLAAGALDCARTSSVGRLFDAVAALCGVRDCVTYEGQAAIELEALAAAAGERRPYPFMLVDEGTELLVDARCVIAAVHRDIAGGADPGVIAARFHAGLADVTASACVTAADHAGVDLVALAGGVWQNRLLLERTAAALERAGLRVLVPERLPPGDGAIAFGQVAIAAASEAG
jgi:hydrogenase maturation protein HypF